MPVISDFFNNQQIGFTLLAEVLLVELDSAHRIMLDDVSPDNMNDVCDTICEDGTLCHSFSNCNYNAEGNTVQVLMLKNDFDALPRHTISCLTDQSGSPISKPQVLKDTATIKYSWRVGTKAEVPQPRLSHKSDTIQVNRILASSLFLELICQRIDITIIHESALILQVGNLTEGVDFYSLTLDVNNNGNKMALNPVLPNAERCNRLQLEIQCAQW